MANIQHLITVLVILAFLHGCEDRAEENPFKEGRRQIMAGEYEAGLQQMQAYLEGNRNEAHASRARFFMGKAYLGLGDFELASNAFETTVQDYPGSLEAKKSLYKLALINALEGDYQAAVEGFGAVAEDSASPLSPEAVRMIDWLKRL